MSEAAHATPARQGLNDLPWGRGFHGVSGDGAHGRVLSMNALVAMNLAQLRTMLGLTQEQLGQRLAEMTGKPWSKATMSALERSAVGGRVREFDADLLVLLAMALHVPLPRLFQSVDDRTLYRPRSARPLAARELLSVIAGDPTKCGRCGGQPPSGFICGVCGEGSAA